MNPRDATTAEFRRPSQSALDVAALIKDRLGRRQAAPVRSVFIESRTADGKPAGGVPPLATLLRGGRGGEIRLKLELSFLWFAVAPPHDLMYPARAWATLLDLKDPEGSGTRRIRLAINALEKNRLIEVTSRPGQPNRLILLNEGATGEPYSPPGPAYKSVQATPFANPHRYVQLPDALWTSGWLATLSGAALAMLLVLMTELGMRPAETTDLWFSPSRAEALYGLSEDTRSKGLRELRAVQLVTARRRSASRDALDFRRLRNTYRLDLSRLNNLAAVPVEPQPDAPMGPHLNATEALFAFADRHRPSSE